MDPSGYKERTYRERVVSRGLTSFQVAVKQTDLWVSARAPMTEETTILILQCRRQLETYIEDNPGFVTARSPWKSDPCAPPLVREMIQAARMTGVGPMASVAGAIAQYVGQGLLAKTDEVIVENGGDIFLKTNRPSTVSVFAGNSPLSERVGLLVREDRMPLGVCSSSGTVGHSLSLGVADVVCILSSSAALGDSAATALGNRIKTKKDLARAAKWGEAIKGIAGGVVILGDRMAAWGAVELVTL